MFTGIVQGMGELVACEEKQDFRRHVVRLPSSMLTGLTLGASVAHNGCCLTVSAIDGACVAFDLMQETLRVTNLGALRLGERVNLERAARFGDEIGGHAMSGHIYCQGKISEVLRTAENRTLWIALPPAAMKYVLTKGYIGVDGASLTIGAVRGQQFCVHLIPETLARTTLGTRVVGERVNIEIDPQTQAIVDTVERVLAQQSADNHQKG